MPRTRAEELALRARIRPWADIAKQAIQDALLDCESHAARLVVQSTDGSPDFFLAARSPFLAAANRRLDLLGQTLLYRVQEARIEFYQDSHRLHASKLNPEIHQVEARPSYQGAVVARDAAIHGRPLQSEVANAITAAKHRLLLAVDQAKMGGDDRQRMLKGWRTSVSEQLNGKCESWLSDASHALHDALSFALIKPSLRPEFNL